MGAAFSTGETCAACGECSACQQLRQEQQQQQPRHDDVVGAVLATILAKKAWVDFHNESKKITSSHLCRRIEEDKGFARLALPTGAARKLIWALWLYEVLEITGIGAKRIRPGIKFEHLGRPAFRIATWRPDASAAIPMAAAAGEYNTAVHLQHHIHIGVYFTCALRGGGRRDTA